MPPYTQNQKTTSGKLEGPRTGCSASGTGPSPVPSLLFAPFYNAPQPGKPGSERGQRPGAPGETIPAVPRCSETGAGGTVKTSLAVSGFRATRCCRRGQVDLLVLGARPGAGAPIIAPGYARAAADLELLDDETLAPRARPTVPRSARFPRLRRHDLGRRWAWSPGLRGLPGRHRRANGAPGPSRGKVS